MPSPRLTAFTLLELLVAVSIIGLLASLFFPVFGRVYDQLNTTKCVHNMKQVSVAIKSAAIDNSGDYPMIENDPANPIHDAADGKIWTLPELVQHYGATVAILRCPADEAARLCQPKGAPGTVSYFKAKGSSYEWFPMFEGDSVNAPRIVSPRGVRSIPAGRARLLLDYAESGEGPHKRELTGSTMHVAYADGSVRAVLLAKQP